MERKWLYFILYHTLLASPIAKCLVETATGGDPYGYAVRFLNVEDFGTFGMNARGPVQSYFAHCGVNYLLIQSLEVYGNHWDNEYQSFSRDIASRIVKIFLTGNEFCRPVHGKQEIYSKKEDWKDLVLFYEYFHGNTGRGCGASHQTGWTGLVANLIHKLQGKKTIRATKCD